MINLTQDRLIPMREDYKSFPPSPERPIPAAQTQASSISWTSKLRIVTWFVCGVLMVIAQFDYPLPRKETTFASLGSALAVGGLDVIQKVTEQETRCKKSLCATVALSFLVTAGCSFYFGFKS